MPSPSSAPDPYVSLSPSLRRLAERGVAKRFRKGHRLIEEGDTGDSIYIVTKGRLRVFSSHPNGREITYGIYGAGEYIGEMSLDGGPRSASVEALEAIECIQITRQSLLLYIAECPEFALELLSKVIRRARAATLGAKQLALNDAYGRLALLLNELAEAETDGYRRIAERLTHRDIASRLGCSREMVSRLMKDLELGGFIGVDASNAAHYRLLKPLPARW